MTNTIIGPLFRAVVVAGALAASVYAAMVPLAARSDQITEMRYLAPPGRVTFPELAEDLHVSRLPECQSAQREQDPRSSN